MIDLVNDGTQVGMRCPFFYLGYQLVVCPWHADDRIYALVSLPDLLPDNVKSQARLTVNCTNGFVQYVTFCR